MIALTSARPPWSALCMTCSLLVEFERSGEALQPGMFALMGEGALRSQLLYEHGIAEAQHAIARVYGVCIGAHYLFAAGECGNQHHQS